MNFPVAGNLLTLNSQAHPEMTASAHLDNIPSELRSYPHWVCHDATKRPINPKTGELADVSNPETWASFDAARDALDGGRGVGIGFVFSHADPFIGIDLDVGQGAQPSEGQQRIYDAFETYAEQSPSGRGLHIIAKGQVHNGGVRNSALGVEVYSSGRFFTFTGQVVRAASIQSCQDLIDRLCEEIAPHRDSDTGDVIDPNPAPSVSDETLRERICESDVNRDYYEGRMSDWSAAYFALICAACLFSSDEAQVRRVVMESPLVQDTPPKGRETRSQKAARLWSREYRRAAAKGAEERQASAAMRRSVNIDLSGQIARTFGLASPQHSDVGWFPASDFAGKPCQPRPWHVRGLIPTGQVTALYGDGGTGKSTVAMQLAASTALGVQWLGQDVRDGGVIYLSAEDDAEELHRRLTGMGDLSAMQRLTLRSLAGEDALLAVPQGRTGVLAPTALFHALDARMCLERPALLVLDTLADFFGGNENDRAQARQFVGMLRGLAIRHQCAVLLLSHPSVAGIASGAGSSGSTAWSNSVRSRLYLSRITGEDGYEANPDARRLTVKKSNYGRIGNEIMLHWDKGIFVAAEVPTQAEHYAKAESVFLKLLVELTAQGRRVNTSGGQTYAPTVFAAHPNSDGITKRAFKDAMEKLLATGRVVTVETGPASKRRSHIELGNAVPTLFQPENRQFQPPSNPSTDPHSNPLPTGGVPTPL